MTTSSAMPVDWRAAVLAINAISSSKVVMSSININKPVAAMGGFPLWFAVSAAAIVPR
ncbi:hypothetical protein D3C71_1899790 [compost metagenome]